MNVITPDQQIASPSATSLDKWHREQRAFYRLLGELLPAHRGDYVAIHDGQVVASGPDMIDVALKAYALHGYQPIYVDLVADHPLPAVRMPHYRRRGSYTAVQWHPGAK